ncbi:hypothetical protein IU414_27185 [Nocardia farcinica]|uniref:hypothetical protein n=1 Tax=Nocardia TaxID=1817 RepID=UPI00031F7A8B|nr:MULTISPECIES: hypothetical protein [Nocardia]MBF6588431.1 hypothetical protein [Nocardia farcinica]
MSDGGGIAMPFLSAVSVSPSVVAGVDSVVVLAEPGSGCSSLHGGWISDVDRARAAANSRGQVGRARARPPVSNQQFRILPGPGAEVGDPVVRAVRIPAPGDPGWKQFEVSVFWAGMQLVADTRVRIGEVQARTVERLFRGACGAAVFARAAGVEDAVIRESLTDVVELAELLIRARDSRAQSPIHVGVSRDDIAAQATAFLASGLPSAATIEMRERDE